MRGLSTLFPARFVLFFRDNRLIGAPEICITGSTTICLWKRVPEFLTGDFAAISNHKPDNLARFSAESQPNPALLCFLADKRPEFIQFKRDATRIARNCWNQCLRERCQTLGFFLASQSQYYEQHRTFVPIRASYCAPDRRAGSFLAVVLNMLSYQGCLDFAAGRSDRGIFACHSGQYRIL